MTSGEVFAAWHELLYRRLQETTSLTADSITPLLQQFFGPLGALAIQAAMIDPHWYLRGSDDDE